MDSRLKKIFTIIYFFIIYSHFYTMGFLSNNVLSKYNIFLSIFSFSCWVYIIFLFKKYNILYKIIVFKIIVFTFMLAIYFSIEQSLITIVMYNIGGSGGYIRNFIYHDYSYQFKWYEILFWNFIFSLHYPVYIFIFIKPFINHIDKSIKKIKLKNNV